MHISSKYPLGFKVIIGFHLLNIILWTIGQGGAVVSYDLVAQWGLQDPRLLLNPAIVEVNRGIGLADMIIMIPLFVIAVVGLWRLKFYGAVVSWLALGISLYWPVAFLCSQYFYGQANIKYNPTDFSTLAFLLVLFFITIWATWYLYKNKKYLH
jgi:hypothetical protein